MGWLLKIKGVAMEQQMRVSAAKELRQVLQAWRRGEGKLLGLLVAWWEIVTGRVVVG